MIVKEAVNSAVQIDAAALTTLANLQLRALAISAMKGSRLSQKALAEITSTAEARAAEERLSAMENALEYKQKWTAEIERCNRLSVTAPTPLPHPDDIHIDMRSGQVRTEGPLDEREKREWDIHAVGLFGLSRLLRLEERQEAKEHVHPLSPRGMAATMIVILGLFILHGIEIWLYALLYVSIGSVEGLREAVYFSTITYGAIGYDDAAMAESWRLVSAIEGINGIVLIGWSTAFFVTLLARMRRS